ncbi:hypothetical protein B0T14DRAFT_522189 [Immersiella caudata]|uniref:Uncharacterized protein n=1 Tax=Immersiella caudata TaxID=314043 RepID=A0AA39WSJ9_9PEZI|nr:hypothetical protein B0T14DRAFT_522189 [Immersiella caudata]
MRTDFKLENLVLSPLDTTDSIYVWAIGRESGQLGDGIPELMVLHRLANEIFGPHIAQAKQQATNTKLHYDQSRAWSERHTQLYNLVTFVGSHLEERVENQGENLLAGSFYDYDSLVRQMMPFANSPPSDLSSGPFPTTVRENGRFTYGPGTITYTKTVKFLCEECSPDLVDLLLQLLQALHTGKFANRDIWSLSEPDPRPEVRHHLAAIEQELESIGPAQRETAASLPQTSSEEGKEVADRISVLTKSQDEVNALLERLRDLSRHLNAKKETIGAVSQYTFKPFQNRTFFVTRGGLPGVGTMGVRDIRAGDKILWPNDMHHPLIARPSPKQPGSHQHYEVVGTAVVRGIMGGRLRLLGENMPPTQKFLIV